MVIEKESVLWNTLFLTGSAFARRFFAFGTMLLLTRYLGPAEYGKYIFVVTFLGFAASFWSFGLNIVYVRDVSADPLSAPGYLGGVLIGKTVLTVLSAPFLYLILLFVNDDPSVLMPSLIFGLATYFLALEGTFSSVFSYYRRMDLSSYLSFFQGLFTLILVYICVKMDGRLSHFFLCHLGVSLLLLVASALLSLSFYTVPSFRVDPGFVWQLCRKGLPLFMTAMANLTLFRIDHLILAKLSDARMLGLYGSAYTIFEIVVALLPMLFMTASFPALSEEFAKKGEAFSHLTQITIKYFLTLGIPISVGSILLGNQIVDALYGSQFHEAGLAFSMLGGGIWCFFLTIALSWILTAMHQQKIVLISNVVGLVVNVFLNLMLIPRYGFYAAAGTTVLCEIVQLAIMGRAVLKVISPGINAYIWKVLLGTAVMCVCVVLFLMQGDFVNRVAGLALTIGTSGAVFGGVCYLLGLVNRNELRILVRR